MADGSVPEPTLDRPKNFPKLPLTTERSEAAAQRMLDASLDNGEIRG